MNEINYIADFSVPNKSAYAVHVFKICDSFVKKKKLNLYLYSNENNIPFYEIKKNYNLKENFQIHYCFKKKRKRNILNNLIFSFWLKKRINKNSYILSRSIIPAIILKLFSFKIVLEIHHEMTGLTKKIYNSLDKFNLLKNLNYIFIHKNLKKKFKKKNDNCIILDDGVAIEDFKLTTKKVKKNCIYTGSFAPGKGIEFLAELAKDNPKVKFCAYGNITDYNHMTTYKEIKNLKFMNYVYYNKIPKILKSNLILLMPYRNQIGILAKNISVENYISPLKLFEYLAASNLIIASKLKVYEHILKDKYNCFLCSPNDKYSWNNNINKIIKNPKNFLSIKKNAFKTAKKYTWDDRAKKILNFFEEKF